MKPKPASAYIRAMLSSLHNEDPAMVEEASALFSRNVVDTDRPMPYGWSVEEALAFQLAVLGLAQDLRDGAPHLGARPPILDPNGIG